MKRTALLLLAGLVLVTACTETAEDHNAQDVTFAQEMIPHHTQAVEMADMAPAQAESAQVKDLAVRIKAAQGPEIEMMTGWLSGWGEKTSSDGDMGGMAGMDHGGGTRSGMQGMMSDDQMQDLQGATGAAFDRLFLTMMIAHHEGAVAMARTELDNGKFPAAKQLAQDIIDGQEKEIAEMKGLLGGGA